MTLREIFEELRPLLDLIETGEDVDEQTLKDTFEAATYPMEEKLDSYFEAAASLERDANAIKAERERLYRIEQGYKNNAERLKETAAYYVGMLPERKLKSQYHTFGYRKDGGKLPLWFDEDKVPKKYLKVTTKVDTDAVRELLDSGKNVKWAHYGERGESFTWR